MKFRAKLVSASAIALLCAAGVSAAVRQEGAVQPTEQHKWLLSRVGTWDTAMSGMMGDSKGTWVVKEGPGGLWTVGEYTAVMATGPFKGMEFMGYDAAKGEFNQVWIDSWTPTPLIMKGKFDKATQKLVLEGESEGPDGKPVKMTQVTHFEGPDSHTWEMQGPGQDGKPTTFFAIKYTRRK
jgi:hypothetical protein